MARVGRFGEPGGGGVTEMGIQIREDAIRKTGIDPLRTVDNSVYTPEAFDLERERIFRKVWNFICHESEVRHTGDFVTRELAGESVLVARDHAGRLRAYYNVCRHRGSMVAREESGHCKTFRCPYHWWVYSLEGDLVNVPGVEAYDGTGFRMEDYGLVPVRVESVLGLVFVCLDPEAEPLTEHLGQEVIETLETPLALAEFEVFHTYRWPLRANWKGWAENSRDGYHVPFVHPFFRKASPPREYRLLINGHAVQRLGMEPAGVGAELWEEIRRFPLPGVQEGDGYIAVLFPDVGITLRNNVVSIEGQVARAFDDCLFESRVLGLAGDSEEVRGVRRKSWEVWFNNPVSLEDKPILENQQRGLQSRGVTTSLIARGPDSLTGVRGDDNRLRQFWARWRQLMGRPSNSIRA